jgi:hypothetical protein
MIFVIVLAILGIVAIAKGELPITKTRRVSGNNSRILGAIMLVGAALNLFIGGAGLVALVVAIVVGLATAEHVDTAPSA